MATTRSKTNARSKAATRRPSAGTPRTRTATGRAGPKRAAARKAAPRKAAPRKAAPRRATPKRPQATRTGSKRTASTGGARRRAPQLDAIRLLKDDHRTVKELFKRYKQLGERSSKSKRAIVEKVVRELSIHAAIEEEFLYPAIRRVLPDEGKKLATEGLEEHRAAKRLLSDIDGTVPEGQEFEGRFKLLMEDVVHHIREEETELFPRFRQAVEREELVRLGQMMKTAKKAAPTRPHPMAPDTPPGNLVTNVGAAVVDRARDAARALLNR